AVLIDLGTGARASAQAIGKRKTPDVLVLLTHYHLDHLFGLPSLPILYEAGTKVTLAAPRLSGREIGSILPRLIGTPFWPIPMHKLPATVHFRTLAAEGQTRPLRWHGLRVRWARVHHPGGCAAYRIDEPSSGASLVFATDIEWAESTPIEKTRFTALLSHPSPAGLLCMDGAYDDRSYATRRGWGHSRWSDVIHLAVQAGVRRVRILHPDPDAGDAALRRMDQQVQKACSFARLAREGERIQWP
ncbi:MAG: MBL fold metallo-hydrolase, partial [Kiritimatiellia bacterium]|nr:MBL fold metallo-hydrolase [Kiritimatiellia bacterium]